MGVYNHVYSKSNNLDFTSFTSRAFNNSIPGPTLRLKRGNQYIINFTNTLGPEASTNPTKSNVIKDVNTTNIHLHGVQISGMDNSDNIFDVVGPNGYKPYHFYIPCDHAGGTFWYHSHHHQSTSVQVGGGAAGALIIEDSPKQENIPDYYMNMKEYIVVIEGFDFEYLQELGQNEPDQLFSYDNSTGPAQFILINGLYLPTICINEYEWTKLRVVHVDNRDDLEIVIVRQHAAKQKLQNKYWSTGDNYTSTIQNNVTNTMCNIRLFAKDGVLLHGSDNTTPRIVKALYLTPSSRADIAINCDYIDNSTNYEIYANGDLIGYIKVIKSNEKTTVRNVRELATFSPNRPVYLTNLLDYNGPMQTYGDNNVPYFSISINATTINSKKFNATHPKPQAYLRSGLVNEWHINGSSKHPFHIHIFHYQIYSGGIIGPANWTLRGDWIDTMHQNGVIRFTATKWGGNVILHCHILKHEDEGSMALVYINGGCNWNLTSFVDSSGEVVEPACNSTCYPPWNTFK